MPEAVLTISSDKLDYSSLSLEIVRTASGTRMYLNTYSLPLSPVSDNTNKIELTLSTENGSCPVFVDSLEGGQRLIIPSDVASDVICHLLEGKPVTLSIGRYQSTIIPDNFASVYHRLRS